MYVYINIYVCCVKHRKILNGCETLLLVNLVELNRGVFFV